MFSFIRNWQTISLNRCTVSHFHQQYMTDPGSLHSCQHLLLFISFIVAYISHFVRCIVWYFTAVLIALHFNFNLNLIWWLLMLNTFSCFYLSSVCPLQWVECLLISFFFFNLNCFVVVLLCFHVELLRVLYIFQILV